MTYVPGIEGLHAWTPPGASEPAVVLGEGVYRLTGITGLDSLGDPEDNSDLIVGGVGENPRLSQRRGKTLAYEGRIVAGSLLELREAISALKAAFADQSTLGRMDLSAHPGNAELAGQIPKYLEARALSCDVIDQQTTRNYTRRFVVGLRMKDPRVWDAVVEEDSAATTKTETPSSVTVDFPPIAKGPVLKLELPASAADEVEVIVRNVTNGRSMLVKVLPPWEGDVLTLDFGAKTVVDTSGKDRSGMVDVSDNSLWTLPIPFPPGSNELQVEASVATTLYQSRFPGTVVSDATIAGAAWANPGNAKAEEGGYATAEPKSGESTQYLKATNYGFTLPSTAEVLGTKPSSAETSELGEAVDRSVKLVKGGVISGEDRLYPGLIPGPWPKGAGLLLTHGNGQDMFGLSLLYSDVNAAGFGWAISAKAPSALSRVKVDFMRLFVAYRDRAPVAYSAKATLQWVAGYN